MKKNIKIFLSIFGISLGQDILLSWLVFGQSLVKDTIVTLILTSLLLTFLIDKFILQKNE